MARSQKARQTEIAREAQKNREYSENVTRDAECTILTNPG